MCSVNLNEYKSVLEKAKAASEDYLSNLHNMPAYPGKEALNNLSIFDEPMPEDSTKPEDVIELLSKYGAPATCASSGGRSFGFVQGGILPAALGASWLVDTWNQNAGFYDMSPVSAAIEGVTEKWIAELFGFPEDSAMGLVTGSATGLLTCFIAARNELIRRQGWDVRKQGFKNAPPIRIVLSAEAHSTVMNALYHLGFGTDEMEFVPVDEYGRMIPSKVPALDERTLFILQAGHIVGGSYDPIDELADMGRAAGAWVHVDGAFGLWAAVSENQEHFVKGLGKADSCNMDAHKTLNSGYDNSIILCRDRSALESSLALGGSYVSSANTNRNNNNYTPEMSRRARGIILWAALKELGRDGLRELIDNMCECTEYFAERLEEMGYEKPNPVFFNQFFINLPTDEETKKALAHLQSSGITWMGGATWKGSEVIRISVSSINITTESIDECLPAFREALAKSL